MKCTTLGITKDELAMLTAVTGPGKDFFVDAAGSDVKSGTDWANAFKTYGAAYDAARSDKNDRIFVNGLSTIVEPAMVTVAKNRLHTIGVNGMLGHFGQGAKISCALSTGATNIATILNTGVRNTFIGLKVMNSNLVAEGLYAWAEGGEFTRFFNMEFYKDTDLDETGAAEFLHNGDSAQFYDCTFGSLANIIADNKIRPNVLLTATLAGKKCRDSIFQNCYFFSKAGGTEHVAVYGANATDVERLLAFDRCKFVNNKLAAATPAHAIGFGAAQTEGVVLADNCTSADFTVLAQAAVGIYVSGPVPTFATSGISVVS